MLEKKIKSTGGLAKAVAVLKRQGKKIVFTNGCFDLIHYGHVKYLEKAKAKGDCLVVAVNSDSSVRRLKGSGRPVVGQRYRASVVAALESVDLVVIFGEDTPEALIRRVKPDVLVKGADWKPGQIAGADFVLASGGRVQTIVFEKGFSTTTLLKNIAKAC